VAALLLCLLTALQDRPSIVEIRPVTGGFARSGCWLPLRVRLTGPAGFEGEIAASADAGFGVSRSFRIASGGTIDLVLPVVLLARDAKVEVVLRGPSGDIDRKPLATPLQFLGRERLVLIDPKHPEFESWQNQPLALPNGTRVQFAASDPAGWNEAAEMGALEVVDAVVPSPEKSVDLTMTVWRALGGALVTEPRRDLVERLAEPGTRFPVVDALVGRMTVNETWIAGKRDATLLFIVIYGFAFFVAVFVTWSRRSGAWLLVLSALGMAGLFVAAFGALYPKGSVALRSWQGIVDAPEAPVAISVSALWGSGRAGDLAFGRILKPVYPSDREAARRPLQLAWTGERWLVRGAAPGEPVRFVTVERLASLDPLQAYLDDKGKAQTFAPDESDYFKRVPRKASIRLQNPATAPDVPAAAEGLIESRSARVFRVEIRR
jgi:hypothetical protein